MSVCFLELALFGRGICPSLYAGCDGSSNFSKLDGVSIFKLYAYSRIYCAWTYGCVWNMVAFLWTNQTVIKGLLDTSDFWSCRYHRAISVKEGVGYGMLVLVPAAASPLEMIWRMTGTVWYLLGYGGLCMLVVFLWQILILRMQKNKYSDL